MEIAFAHWFATAFALLLNRLDIVRQARLW
jgi:hypothetical protein